MTWYLQYQRAEDIIAEHERRAREFRLARLYDQGDSPELHPTSTRSPLLRAIGGTVRAVGGATTRLGGTLTRIGHAVDGAEATRTA